MVATEPATEAYEDDAIVPTSKSCKSYRAPHMMSSMATDIARNIVELIQFNSISLFAYKK